MAAATIPKRLTEITAKRAIKRIEASDIALEDWRKLVYDLRRIFFGDKSVLYTGTSTQKDQKAVDEGWSDEKFADLLVQEFNEGSSNDIMKAVRTLIWQTSFHRPKLMFPDLEDYHEAFNAGYFESLMEESPIGCSGYAKLGTMVGDLLVSGVGCTTLLWRNGRPAVKWQDSIKVKWDVEVKDLYDATWVGVEVTESVASVIEQYGWEKVSRYVDFNLGDDAEAIAKGLDGPMTYVKYWDTDGPDGHYYVFVKDSGNTGYGSRDVYYDEPIYESQNPCYMEVAGVKRPFLPIEVEYIFAPAGVRMPKAHIENMIASQMAVWNTVATIRDQLNSNKGFYMLKESAVQEKQIEKLRAQAKSGFVLTNDINCIREVKGLTPPQFTMEYLAMNRSDIVAQSGADPYAMGGSTNPAYSSEVYAIKSAAGLTASVISAAHAMAVTRIARKLLAMGKIADNGTFSIPIDGIKLTFGPSNPPDEFIEPYTAIEVADDYHMFMPREQRIQESRELLLTAMKLAPLDPATFGPSVFSAYTRLLRSMGIRNMRNWVPNGMSQAQQVAAALQASSAQLNGENTLSPADEGLIGVRRNGQTPDSPNNPEKSIEGKNKKSLRDRGK